MQTAKKWWYIWPGMVYGQSCEFEKPITRDQFEEYLKELCEMESLPEGTQIWKGNK